MGKKQTHIYSNLLKSEKLPNLYHNFIPCHVIKYLFEVLNNENVT